MASLQLNTQSILAWVQLSQQLAVLGINAAAGIKNAIKALQPDVTDEQLNAIVEAVINDATRRKLIAEADARGEGPQPVRAATPTSGKVGQPTSAVPVGSDGRTGTPAVSGQVPPPPPGTPVGTDGVLGTPTANDAPDAPGGPTGKHSHVDRPAGGLPGTKSA